MAITQSIPVKLPPNPHVVYFVDNPYYQQELRDRIVAYEYWFGEEQQRAVNEWLAIPSEFGDPVLAVMMCALRRDKHFGCTADRVGGHDENGRGEYVSLRDFLGEDRSHLWRCRDVVHRLSDSVEWNCLCRDRIPGEFWTDSPPAEILRWAVAHDIPLTDAGAARHSDLRRSGATVSRAVFPKRLRGMDTDDPLRDYMLKEEYEDGWTPALGDRLRAALRTFGMTVYGDPVEEHTHEASAAPVKADTATGKAGGAEKAGAKKGKKGRPRQSHIDKVLEADFKAEVKAAIACGIVSPTDISRCLREYYEAECFEAGGEDKADKITRDRVRTAKIWLESHTHLGGKLVNKPALKDWIKKNWRKGDN